MGDSLPYIMGALNVAGSAASSGAAGQGAADVANKYGGILDAANAAVGTYGNIRAAREAANERQNRLNEIQKNYEENKAANTPEARMTQALRVKGQMSDTYKKNIGRAVAEEMTQKGLQMSPGIYGTVLANALFSRENQLMQDALGVTGDANAAKERNERTPWGLLDQVEKPVANDPWAAFRASQQKKQYDLAMIALQRILGQDAARKLAANYTAMEIPVTPVLTDSIGSVSGQEDFNALPGGV